MAVEIRETKLGGNLKPFLEVVEDIYRDDPNYVRSLDLDVRDRLSPKSSFFEHAEGTTFTAWRQGKCVGRSTAHIDWEHLAKHQDNAGFFGFFDTVNDAEVAKALLERVEQWVAGRGMKAVRGPLSLSVNEELGCLVEGFDTPPMVMMPHHRPWQGELIEAAGYAKLKDLFAWSYVAGDLPARALKSRQAVLAMPEVRARPADFKHFARDVAIIMDVYNDAWADNWGMVPMTRKEMDQLAALLRLIAIPELIQIVSVHDEPVAVSVTIPNLNEMIADLHGKLFPLGVAKLLWRLKVRGPSSARVIILGIRRKLRGVRRYAALSTFLYTETHLAAKRLGIHKGELSWTLEDNGAVTAGIRFMGGKIYKRYRLYEKALTNK